MDSGQRVKKLKKLLKTAMFRPNPTRDIKDINRISAGYQGLLYTGYDLSTLGFTDALCAIAQGLKSKVKKENIGFLKKSETNRNIFLSLKAKSSRFGQIRSLTENKIQKALLSRWPFRC